MILERRFYDPKLAQVSYLIGSTDTKQAVVIDANRDVEQYLRAAAEEGVAITQVTETHIHADYVSGTRELAALTGAKMLLSAEGGAGWQYAFALDAGAVLLHDGDTFDIGTVRFQALHTPGHTPEHLMFLVTDTSAVDRPVAAVTGDFLFVGDVGRPDLLERAAHVAGTMEAAARDLFRSLDRLDAFPDYLQIWPGHGAGSACGKGLGSLPQTTLGYERLTNWALQPMSEDDFVTRVLTGQPDPPRYFGEMKRVNKEGPSAWGSRPRRPELLDVERLETLVTSGAVIVDTRTAAEFAAAHIPGTINIPLNRAFTTWAGSFLPYDTDFSLIAGDGSGRAVEEAVRDLAMIGLDRVGGYAPASVLKDWERRGHATERIGHVDADDTARRLADRTATVLDVRSTTEWQAGHVRGARHIPMAGLLQRIAELPAGPLIVYCQGGARSAIAASLLRRQRRSDVMDFSGGFNAWRASGRDIEQEPEAALSVQ